MVSSIDLLDLSANSKRSWEDGFDVFNDQMRKSHHDGGGTGQ